VLWNDPATGVMRHADAGYEAGHGGHRVYRRHVLDHLRLALLEHLETHGQEVGHDRLGLRGIAAHQVGQHGDGQDALAAAFMLGDDLQEILARQVVAGFQIDDLHLAAFADEACDILERDVVRGFGVVEATACVALDQQRVIGRRFGLRVSGRHGGLPLLRCSIA
jgi:hypothetical protein